MSGHNHRNHDQLGEVLYPDREPRERSGEAASSSSSSSSHRAEVVTGILVDLGDSETSRMKREDGGTARMKREDDEAARMKREDDKAARVKREDDEAARMKREDDKAERMKREDDKAARVKREDDEAARMKREDDKAARMKREDDEAARMKREDGGTAKMKREDDEAARMKRENEGTARMKREDGGTAKMKREDDEAARMKRENEGTARTWREDGASSCFLLDELKRLPQCDNKLGHLSFSKTHTILVDAPAFNCGAGLLAQEGRDMWVKHFVKMPCSPLSVMIVKTGLVKTNTQTRRWDVISKQLSGLAKKTSVSVDAVEEAIMKYNPKYKGQWSFDALSSFVKAIPKAENYFPKLFPKMAALALSLPDCVKKAVPLLRRGFPAVVTLSQVQISCLLANAFFCTFPHRNASGPNTEYHDYPTINFNSLFGSWSGRKKEKLRALLHYFHVVTDEKAKPEGLVTFERRCLGDADMPNWRRCKEKMSKLHVTSHGTIETEGTGLLQVDFASSWIGGGVLGSGLVQEEILFLINPELIVSRLFTEKLADNECLVVTGSQQFSCYSGYGDSFEWAGPHEDRLDRDEWKRRKRQTLAIDAVHFRHRWEQYNMTKVTRELNKAYCGFKGQAREEPDIATGKWGCGAFNGDPQLKAVIQLMAAAKAKRGLAFFTFQDEELNRGLQQTYHLLVTEGTTVEKLYGLLEDYCAAQQASGHSHVDLFEFIRNCIRGSRSQL